MTAPHPALALAAHWLELGRPERALEELGRLPGDEVVRYRAMLLRAVALHAGGWHAQASQAAEHGLGFVGPDPELLSVLGHARQALGRHPEAERAYLDGLAHDPTHVGLLCAYAELCVKVGQVDKADQLLRRAAAREPGSDRVLRVRTLLEHVRGRDDRALAHSRESLRRDPDDASSHALHGVVRSYRGDARQAARSLGRAAAAHPDDTDVVEAAREARLAAHPLLLPLRLVARVGALKLWLAIWSVVLLLRATGLVVVPLVLAAVWVLLAVYSWVAPPLVRRLVRRGR